MAESIEVSTIKLYLNGISVEISVNEARKLWASLDELFGAKPAPWVIPYYPPLQPTIPWAGDNYPLRIDYGTAGLPDEGRYRIICNAYHPGTLEVIG